MSVVGRKRDKHANTNKLSGNDPSEGSAARIRPLSFEEIIFRRRKKKLFTEAKKGADDPRASFEEGYTENASDHSVSAGDEGLMQSKSAVKGTSKNREEKSDFNKEIGNIKGRDKRRHVLDENIKVRSDYEKSRDKEKKNEKQSHHKSKTDDHLKADAEKVFEKKHSKEASIRENDGKKDVKPRQGNKRRHHDESYEKTISKTDGSVLKKHDHGKWETKHPERKERKYDEPKSKRRRSRSREKDHDRDRRSISVSPRAHKRSYHERDIKELSSHSFKDRSGRQYSDADKYRTSGHGAYESVRYRRRGSGLGGYSPRKRRSEAAVKTPSPTARSPEKKVATWDQPPAGTNHASSGSMLADLLSSSMKVPELSAPISVIPTPAKPQTSSLTNSLGKEVNTTIDSVELTQARHPSRRLYVENLPASATEKSLMECLNDFLLSSGVGHTQQTQPCISCIINKEKCQAVVEFLTPEDATNVLSFDGRSLSGSVLKFRRPKDYIESTDKSAIERWFGDHILGDYQITDKENKRILPKTGVLENVVPSDAISDVVPDSPHKIFIGGISKALSYVTLKEIVSVFGRLKAYRFEFSEELNKPCAFLEYIDESVTLRACAGLNGIKLAGHALTVVKALPNTHGEEENADRPPYGIPEHAKPLLEDPTHVLKLKNMFDQVEFALLSEIELEETLEDIRLECARFGTVRSINIVRCSSSNHHITPETVQHDPTGGLVEVESIEEPSDNDFKHNDGVTALNDVAKEPEDVMKVLETTDTENSIECVEEKEPNNNSEAVKDENQEELPHLDNTEDLQTSTQEVADVKVEEGSSMQNGLDPEELQMDDADAKFKEHSTESSATIVQKAEINGNLQNSDLDVFEPGCVLVEFSRTDATCMVAHCLHGRIYNNRVVAACYVPLDVYLGRFPR